MKPVHTDAAGEMYHLEVRDSVTTSYDGDAGAKGGKEGGVLGVLEGLTGPLA